MDYLFTEACIKYKTVNLKQVYLAICPSIKVCFGVCVCVYTEPHKKHWSSFILNEFIYG